MRRLEREALLILPARRDPSRVATFRSHVACQERRAVLSENEPHAGVGFTAHARRALRADGARAQPMLPGWLNEHLESARSRRYGLISRSDLDTGGPGRPPRPSRRRNTYLKIPTSTPPLWPDRGRGRREVHEIAIRGLGDGDSDQRVGRRRATAGDGGRRREMPGDSGRGQPRASQSCNGLAHPRAETVSGPRRSHICASCGLGYTHTVSSGHLAAARPAQSASGCRT